MTRKIHLSHASWEVECLPEDGARISSLKYKGYELLTTAPVKFIPPKKDYGEYETRPVYGYDDCFPTVTACQYPNENLQCRDHGQLCWQSWTVEKKVGQLICSTQLTELPVEFVRVLVFTEDKIYWHFEVKNRSGKAIEFLHVMHPLMRLDRVDKVDVPKFGHVVDEDNQSFLELKDSQEVNGFLRGVAPGAYRMLLLKGIKGDKTKITFSNQMSLEIDFDHKLFPTFGIWWNNNGYPDEEGIRRNECAFEPIPGFNSNLEESYCKETYLTVPASGSFQWEISWRINQ